MIPTSHRRIALKGIHDDVGHLGFDRTLDLAKSRYYWPRMNQRVEEYCKKCERCVKRKARIPKAANLVNIISQSPMELVCIDYLCIEPDRSNTKNVLVVTDHFTGYAQAYPTRDQKATTVAKVLWEKFFVHYGFPARLHSDQGKDFDGRLIQELCKVAGIRKSRTTPYHSQCNGKCERFNKTLLDMLGTLQADV